MRTSKSLILVLALAFVAIAGTAAFAAARGGSDASPHVADETGVHHNETKENETAENKTREGHAAPRWNAHNETDEKNETRRGEKIEERHERMQDARHEVRVAFRENRTVAIHDFLDALGATRASFLQNHTKLVETCKAAHPGNDTAEDRCVRDGMTPIVQKAREDIEDAHAALRAALLPFRWAFMALGHGHDG
jgi:hypothetical protein